MITKFKKTIALINGCFICLAIPTISINANAMLSDSVTIDIINKLLKKVNMPKNDIDYKYPPEVEEYAFNMRVSDPKDCHFDERRDTTWDTYNCRFSIFKDGTTKIEHNDMIFKGGKNQPQEEFLDSVDKNSNEFKESLKQIVTNLKFTDQVPSGTQNLVYFIPNLNIKTNGESNISKTTVKSAVLIK